MRPGRAPISQRQIADRDQALARVLASEANKTVEVLAAIGTRCSNGLTDAQLCLDFLEALCQQGQHSFTQILADLLYCAPIRPHILGAFRNPQRSEKLAEAIGALLSPPKNEVH